MIRMPGFGVGAAPPDRNTLLQLTQAGLMPVRAFASPADWANQGGLFIQPVGRPKFWNDPYATTPKNYVTCAQDAQGKYLSETPSRNGKPGNRFWSLSAFMWFDAMAQAGIPVQVPVLKFSTLSVEEARRLDFGFEVEAPTADYPLASFSEDTGNELIGNTFPGGWVVLIEDGAPVYYTLEELNTHPKYKLNWSPRPANPAISVSTTVASGITPAQLVAFASAANATVAFRRNVQAILDNSALSPEAAASALLKLL